MLKSLFTLILIFTVIFIWASFKPAALITYTDNAYMNSLAKCKPYTTTGKLPLFGSKSSISKILGLQNDKCILHTINVFNSNKAYAVTCALDSGRLSLLHKAIQNQSYQSNITAEGKLVKKFIKQGYCTSIRLENKVWVEN